MSVFKSILVGIDLLQTSKPDSSRFSLPVEEAIKHALWLAEKACASVTFFAALPEGTLHPPKADESCSASQRHRQALDQLVESAKQRGLAANAKLVSGEAWVEILREVEHARHDVVIVGTRNVGGLRRFLFGSTAMRLLHHCPCPVWVTRPELKPVPHNILVTSDFSPVSDIAVKLGLAIGELSGANVHVLNAVDYLLDRRYSVGLLHTNREAYHAHIKAEAHQRLTDQLTNLAGGQPKATVELHIVEGESVADTAILEFIEHHQIDLLLMGTVAGEGFLGLTVDNTAERLVTHIPCSMLVVKPDDFESPSGSTTRS
jgi:universal stress protein E